MTALAVEIQELKINTYLSVQIVEKSVLETSEFVRKTRHHLPVKLKY
jgi:hypothetical protein